MLWLNIFESNKNKTLISRKIKWKILFTQSNWNRLQWKFCVKISSGIDSILLTKRTHKMKLNETRRKQENEEKKRKKTMSDWERDREGERIVCELLDCMYSFFHIYNMNGATRASDGIFKTVISNVVLCKRGHRKYYITHLYQMLGKYVDHRWSHARKRSLGVYTHYTEYFDTLYSSAHKIAQ